MIDADSNIKIREHYGALGLTERIKAALATITPENQVLTVAQLAPLDQFHTRGILATAELAVAAGVGASTRVLDLGCGIGGPARHLAATSGRNFRSWILLHGWPPTTSVLPARSQSHSDPSRLRASAG